MKRTKATSIIALAIGIAGFANAQSGTTTLTGTVTDAMCGAKHMMQGASAAKCTRECVKQGSAYALVVGSKVYTLKGKEADLNAAAGEAVTVRGTLKGDTLTVESVKSAPKA